ncbi:hypothetical protein GJ496_011226, partial [Pomphorhynchus laevis]
TSFENMRDYAKKIRNERDNYTPGPENDIPLELQTTLNGFRFLQYDSGLTSGSRTKPLTLGISKIKILNLHFLLFLKGIPYFIRWRVFGSKKFDEKPETRHWRVSGQPNNDGAVYCAVSSCSLLNMLDDELFDQTTNWIVSCQTYEGGFGASPYNEAHGGYSYCGAAALAILSKLHLCDADRFLRWAVFRQMSFEGGFQGRTNKLVDSCYSFWVGALFAIFKNYCTSDERSDGWQFDKVALQDYILFASQCATGGLRDKPDSSSPCLDSDVLRANCFSTLSAAIPISTTVERTIGIIVPCSISSIFSL